MRLILGAAAFVVLGTVTACGSSDLETTAPAPASARANRAEDAMCGLLTASDRRALAGTAADRPMQSDDPTTSCMWGSAGSGETIVEVRSLASDTWIKILPDYIEKLKSSDVELGPGDAKRIAAIETRLGSGNEMSPDAACQTFSQFLELRGLAPGNDTLVSYQHFGAGKTAVTAQTCRDGRFTSALLTRPGLEQSEAIQRKALDAVAKAHDRATGAGG
jgi:hypothetical protein